jgi:ABC-type nitrate/sulfonate/bicarbonate transport system permease component
MTPGKKTFLMILGVIAALFLLAQLGLGLYIVNGKGNPNIMKVITAHQHTGYSTVGVSLVYVVTSLLVIAGLPTSRRDP